MWKTSNVPGSEASAPLTGTLCAGISRIPILGPPFSSLAGVWGRLAGLLRSTTTPPHWYLLRATFLAWLPAQVIGISVQLTYPGKPGFSFYHASLKTVVNGLVFAPLLETVLMRLIFFLLRKISRREPLVNLSSALIWGVIHIRSESWGLHAIWSFWVMGLCYLSYEKVSVNKAILMTTGVHLGFNALSFGLTLLMNP